MKKRDLALAIAGGVGAAVAVKLLTRANSVRWEDVAEKVEHAENSHFVNVDGTRIHYQEFGIESDPAIVLIHGFTASVYVWKTAAPLLAAKGFRVIAPDLVGFGYSDKPKAFDYTIQSQARMVSRLMNRLGIGRATIVGSSYGGAVALSLTLDCPESVEKLVLSDTVINDEPKEHPLLKLASLPGVGEVITPFLIDSKAFLRMRMKKTLSKANQRLITDERIESIRRPLYAADGHHSVLATSRNWHANRLENDAHLIDQPTLIVWGEEDMVIPIKNGYKLHEAILNSRFVVLPNCGHVPQEEKGELFTELVSEFCHDKKGKIAPRSSEEVRVES